MNKHKFAITMGDPAGIGAEILVKMLDKPETFEKCIPVVVGDEAAIADAISFVHANLKIHKVDSAAQAIDEAGVVNLIDLGYLQKGGWEYKKVSKLCGEASFQYVIKGIRMAMDREVDAVVTGPINKESINLAGHHYSGHTEIFADYTNSKAYGMLLISNALRVIHVTTHVSMRDACDVIRNHPERVEQVITLADEAMKLLGVDKPRVGVAGLNAHCSENGLFGDEEMVSIIPAIQLCKAKGICVDGPVPPDTVFVKAIAGQYDVVVAMYHDQGHIPLKLNGFKLDANTKKYTSMSGINVTVGLPIIRTSVDHGTAYGKAGEGRANETSLIEALDAAVVMADKRFPLKG